MQLNARLDEYTVNICPRQGHKEPAQLCRFLPVTASTTKAHEKPYYPTSDVRSIGPFVRPALNQTPNHHSSKRSARLSLDRYRYPHSGLMIRFIFQRSLGWLGLLLRPLIGPPSWWEEVAFEMVDSVLSASSSSSITWSGGCPTTTCKKEKKKKHTQTRGQTGGCCVRK